MRRLKIITLLGLLALSPISRADNSHFIALSQQQVDNLGIKMGKLEPVSRVPLFTAPAKVIVPPSHEFIVSTTQAGLIVKMNASVGDKVAKGEVLGLINSPDLLALQSNYLKAVGALKLASATYNRDKTLRKEGVISGRGEQESFSRYNASTIEVNQARQLLQIAGMPAIEIKQLDSTGQLASQVSIRSPISGRVIERMAVSGTHVDPLSPLYRIANLDELWLEINIPQDHIDDVKIGDKVQVEGSLTEAEINVLGQSVNPENQTVLARAVIKTNPSAVRVGQKVNIQHLQASDAVTYQLPDVAIAHHEGKTYVFIREKDGFKAIQVTILGKQAGGSVITGNFTGDEDIAINNASAIKATMLGLGNTE
ncbi:nickel-cobalt-cadmium resistance protein NccB [Methyloglobulus morosus KoM1]|uniref:Nickel-cobalt-cadmium resistance protein NccB n=1 Tax=Methyloglobulus morosus KoM1 TaxID=1116472 RepID=V5B3R2_9GAMM|nr:efflux RND transporter periplasmic adaptor subunit [Methyloglobulus morosus]ESS67835.1 nickel-cobalt-cadmium resistance protein NccB [Methyloglobulus morosus KoM1]